MPRSQQNVLNHNNEVIWYVLESSKMFEGGPFEKQKKQFNRDLLTQKRMAVSPEAISQSGDKTDRQMYML